MICPNCGGQLDEDNYCVNCCEFFDQSDDDFEEPDYDSMINNGQEICLNCTFWSVSPYGKAYGMYCRKGNGQTDPDDSCFDFIQSTHFANYGDEGQFQFDETRQNTANKLSYWRNR